MKAGFAVAAAGIVVVGITTLVPIAAGDAFRNPDPSRAVEDGAAAFTGDLHTFGFWLAGFGAVAIALAAAVAPQGQPVDPVELARRAWDRVSVQQQASSGLEVAKGVAIIVAGFLVVGLRDALVPMLLSLTGAYLVYRGLFRVLQITGARNRAEARGRFAPTTEHRRLLRQGTVLVGATAIVIGVLGVGL